MAVDTQNKRGSAIAFGLAIILPLSDGVIDQADRQQTAHAYSGILATTAAVIAPSFTYSMGNVPQEYGMRNIQPIFKMGV
jgi:hypothetical protein